MKEAGAFVLAAVFSLGASASDTITKVKEPKVAASPAGADGAKVLREATKGGVLQMSDKVKALMSPTWQAMVRDGQFYTGKLADVCSGDAQLLKAAYTQQVAVEGEVSCPDGTVLASGFVSGTQVYVRAKYLPGASLVPSRPAKVSASVWRSALSDYSVYLTEVDEARTREEFEVAKANGFVVLDVSTLKGAKKASVVAVVRNLREVEIQSLSLGVKEMDVVGTDLRISDEMDLAPVGPIAARSTQKVVFQEALSTYNVGSASVQSARVKFGDSDQVRKVAKVRSFELEKLIALGLLAK